MLIPEYAQACRGQHQTLSADAWVERQPAGCQHPKKVSAGKHQDVSGHGTNALDDTVSPHADLCRRFAAGAAIAEELPAWAFGMDLDRATTPRWPRSPPVALNRSLPGSIPATGKYVHPQSECVLPLSARVRQSSPDREDRRHNTRPFGRGPAASSRYERPLENRVDRGG